MEAQSPVSLRSASKAAHVKKDTEIAQIRDRFQRSTAAVFVDYQGMTVASVTKLRAEFRKAGVEYKVCKNTLVKHAIKDTSYGAALKGALAGMTGIAWSFEDPSAAAKVVKAFRKDNGPEGEKLTVKAGVIDGTIRDAKAGEDQLAAMPGKNELRAKLLATFQAPLQQLVALLNAPAQNFAYLLAAREAEQSK